MQRLLTRAQFQAVLAGNTVAKSPHFALHRQALALTPGFRVEAALSQPPEGDTPSPPSRPLFPQPGLWLGAMVPKRWAKRAVTRNTIKRQIYAMSADFSPPGGQAAFVVRLRRDFAKQEFRSASSDLLKQAVRAELQTLFQTGEQRV